eukprot:UN15940
MEFDSLSDATAATMKISFNTLQFKLLKSVFLTQNFFSRFYSPLVKEF